MEVCYFEYEKVSQTAMVTSYPRIFTDIPYEKEIHNTLKCHHHEEVVLEKNMTPEIEVIYIF